MTTSSVTIDQALYGHPDMAFGGYVAGILASGWASGAKVNFRRPVPVGTTLKLARIATAATLLHDDQLVADATTHDLALSIPALPSWEQAAAASARFVARTDIVQRDCFGCGPDRDPSHGLRIFTAPTDMDEIVAGTWEPNAAFADEHGELRQEYVWAALDCPGGWARKALANAGTPGVTAYLAGALLGPVITASSNIVIGWVIERTGRKTLVGSAIATTSGDLCAVAEALWIDARPR